MSPKTEGQLTRISDMLECIRLQTKLPGPKKKEIINRWALSLLPVMEAVPSLLQRLRQAEKDRGVDLSNLKGVEKRLEEKVSKQFDAVKREMDRQSPLRKRMDNMQLSISAVFAVFMEIQDRLRNLEKRRIREEKG